MNRNEYTQMRNSNTLNVDMLYSYYRMKGGNLSGQAFMAGLNMFPTDQIIQSMDQYYEVTILEDKNKQQIKVY
jgi:acyl-CoA thioesterase